MKKQSLLLLGPTIMIFLGLVILTSVPFTFLFFYSWLAIVPFISRSKNALSKTDTQNISHFKSLTIGLVSGLVFLIAIYGSIPYFWQESTYSRKTERRHRVAQVPVIWFDKRNNYSP